MYEELKLIEAQAAYHAKRNALESKREAKQKRAEAVIFGIGIVAFFSAGIAIRFWVGL